MEHGQSVTGFNAVQEISALHILAIQGERAKLQQLITSFGPFVNVDVSDSWGHTPLIYAVLGDRPECVDLLLKHGASVNALDVNGRTALHWAAHKGHSQCCKLLVSRGAEWKAKDHRGMNVLHLAARGRCSRCLAIVLKLLLPGEVDVQDGQKRTALHLSAMMGHSNQIRLLVKHGGNVGIPDSEGKTPLHWSASSKSLLAVQCIKLLLDYALSVINWQDYEGRTALHLAVADGSKEIVNVLTSIEKCNINSMDNEFRTPLHWAAVLGLTEIVETLLKRKGDPTSSDSNGATPIHYAAQNNFATTVEAFMSHPGIIDEPDLEGRNALLWAAGKGADGVIATMHRLGADLEVADKNGATALHTAAVNGHVDTVQLLCGLQVRLDAKDFQGQTALFYACEIGHSDVVQTLLELNANAHWLDAEGKCPLHVAASGGHAYICQLLMKYGASPNLSDSYGRTPVHCSAFSGYTDCLSMLLEEGANHRKQDNQGMSALHWASHRGHYNVVKLLLDYAAYPNPVAQTDDSYTPLDLALVGGHCEIARLMIDNGGLSVNRVQEMAAIKIQALYRGYRVRKHFNKTWDLLLMHERLRRRAASRRAEFSASCPSNVGTRNSSSLPSPAETVPGRCVTVIKSNILSPPESDEDDSPTFTHMNTRGIKLNRKRFPTKPQDVAEPVTDLAPVHVHVPDRSKRTVEIVRTTCLDVVTVKPSLNREQPRPKTSDSDRPTQSRLLKALPWMKRSKPKDEIISLQSCDVIDTKETTAAIVIQRAWKRSRQQKQQPEAPINQPEVRGHRRGSSFPWGRLPSHFSYNLQIND